MRKARRACPALGHQICAVCCGTKRLTQIKCPADCAYLASAREHPPAAAVRRQQRDVALFVHGLRDFNQRQSQLFLAVNTFIARYQAPQLQPLVDDDIVEAAAALAATFETAARGVIYEHRPASLPAERLAAALRPRLAEAGAGGGSAFERDAASVLRRLEETAREVRASDQENRRAYLDLLDRVLRKTDEAPAPGDPGNPGKVDGRDSTGGEDAPRLIVP
jgi:hypothetical protein